MGFIVKHPSKKQGSNGKWIIDPKCMHIKMKSLMLNFLQPLSSSNCLIIRQWKTRELV